MLPRQIPRLGFSTMASMSSAGGPLPFARAGPLYPLLSPAPPAADWNKHADALSAALSADEGWSKQADEAIAVRVHHLYLPIYFWCRALVASKRAGSPAPVAIGLSAAQGCGKTTVVDFLVDLFAADGLTCAAASYDDFYLTGADQDGVAAAARDNRLLQVRGNAGTHDLDLGASTLDGLLSGGPAPLIPRYDKAAREGRGDRAPESAWAAASEGPPDVVLLEGWMAGFRSRGAGDSGALEAIDPGLVQVDAKLAAYKSAWEDRIDGWVVVVPEDVQSVYKWRLQAERAMAAKGRPGMSDEGVADFVSRYMPAYEAYLPALSAASAADGVDGKPTLRVDVDGGRGPVSGAVSE